MSYDVLIQNVFHEVVQLLHYLYTGHGVVSICVTGSYGNSLNTDCMNTQAKDIDFFVVHEKGKKRNVCKGLEDIWGKKNIFRCDDAYRVVISGIEVSFALKEANTFFGQVESIICGNIREENTIWAVGGYMSEVLINDVLSCYILYDPEDYFSGLKNSIRNSWDALRQNLSDRLTEELVYKIGYMQKDRNMYFKIVLLGDLVKQYIRICSLQRGNLCTGLKHVNDSNLFPLDASEQEVLNNILLRIKKCVSIQK